MADGVSRRTSALTVAAVLIGMVPVVLSLALVGLTSAVGGSSSSSAKSGEAPPGAVFGALMLLVLFVMAGQVWSWWVRTYTVLPTELVIDEGILTRHHRVLPYTRVQQIDVHRSLAAQLFGIAEVRVEAAGVGGATSARLRYIDRARAEALRAFVLGRREALRHAPPPAATGEQATRPGAPTAGAPAPPAAAPPGSPSVAAPPGSPSVAAPLAPPPPPRTLLRLGAGRLLLASLTHHTVVVGVPLVLGLSVWISAIAISAGDGRVTVGAVITGTTLAFAALVVFMQVVNTLIVQYGWTLTAEGDDLHLRFGLLEVRNLTVPRARVQQITVLDNPLRRALGICSVTLHTAAMGGGVEGATTTRFDVPIVRRAELDSFLVDLLGDDRWVVPGFTPRTGPAKRRAVTRRTLLLALFLIVPALALAPGGLALLLVALLGIPWGLTAHARAGHGLTGRAVAVSHGVLHHRIDLVPLDRVQGCRSVAAPLQRLSGLTTFEVDVAGTAQAPELYDLDADVARRLVREVPRLGVRAGGD